MRKGMVAWSVALLLCCLVGAGGFGLVAGMCGVAVRLAVARLVAGDAREFLRLAVVHRDMLLCTAGFVICLVAWWGHTFWVKELFTGRSLAAVRVARGVLLAMALASPLALRVPILLHSEGFLDSQGAMVARSRGVPPAPAYAADRCFYDCRGEAPCVRICTNGAGYRDGPFEVARAPEVTRVLLAGDSFVMGSGVADAGRLDVQLEGHLTGSARGAQFEVFNVGVAGFNFHSSVRTAIALAQRYDPDIVVVSFLAANDLELEDVSTRYDRLGPTLTALAARERVEEELFNIEYARYVGLDVLSADPLAQAVRGALAESLHLLLDASANLGFRVVILSYTGDHGLFAAATEEGLLAVVEPPLDWTRREDMTIPGDGHPTAAANALFAGLLAKAMGGNQRWSGAN